MSCPGSTSTPGCWRWPRIRRHPAARAGQVPRHLQPEPRRVLPGPRGRPEGPGRRRRRAAAPPTARTAAEQLARRSAPRSTSSSAPRRARSSSTPVVPGAGRGTASCSPTWTELDDDDREYLADEFFERPDLPGAHAAGGRPGPPVPVHLRACRSTSAVIVRDPVTGERRFARVKVPPLLPRFVVMPDGERFVPLEQVIAAHLDELFPGMEVARQRRLPRHPQRRPHARGGGGRRPARGGRDGAAPAPLRPGGAPRGRGRHLRPRSSSCSRASSSSSDDDVVRRTPRPLDLGGLWSVYGHRPPRPEGRAVAAGHPAPPRSPTRTTPSDIFSVISEGDVLVHHPYDSLLHLGRGVHPPGGRATRRCSPSSSRSTAPRATARSSTSLITGRRARQAGGGAGRAEGPLRRGDQHRVGPAPRAGRACTSSTAWSA